MTPHDLALRLAVAGEPEQAFALARSANPAKDIHCASRLADLAPYLRGDLAVALVDAWLDARRAGPPSPGTSFPIPLPLPARSIQRVVEAMEQLDPDRRAVQLVAIAAVHPAEVLDRARAAVEALAGPARLAGLLHLAPLLHPRERAAVLPPVSAWVRELLAECGRIKRPWHLDFTTAAAKLAPLLPATPREALLRDALAATRRRDDAAERDEAIAELGRSLDAAGPVATAAPVEVASVAEAVSRARAQPDGPGDEVFSLLDKLDALAPADLAMLLRRSLATLSYTPRDEMLTSWTKKDLAHLGPLLAAIGGPAAIRATLAEIVAIGEWMP